MFSGSLLASFDIDLEYYGIGVKLDGQFMRFIFYDKDNNPLYESDSFILEDGGEFKLISDEKLGVLRIQISPQAP